jgi:hypothetical protein
MARGKVQKVEGRSAFPSPVMSVQKTKPERVPMRLTRTLSPGFRDRGGIASLFELTHNQAGTVFTQFGRSPSDADF